jgi:hypothetical protein
MDGQNMNEKSWESFAFNSYTPFCFHDTSLTSSKILQFYQFIYLFIYLLLLLLSDFGFRDFNEGCHFVVMVDVST